MANTTIRKLDTGFNALNNFIDILCPSQIFFLVDENTHDKCLPILLGNFETDVKIEIIEIEAGEELKNIQTAMQLWEILAKFRADRKSLIINLGGGVITDLGGFVASTYKRGIPFINIPTTLLGMCDASLGGKTGIDLGILKNIVGTFAEPEAVFLFTDFLRTLPFIQLRSGFAEMLKHGLIADVGHWEELSAIEELSAEKISPFIARSMQIKSEIVAQDFREKNIRKTLNFGHTIGHAAESLFMEIGRPIPHGEAVAMGIICETKLATLEDLLKEREADEIISKVRKFFPDLDISHFSDDDLINIMLNDKKNSGSAVSFSLLKEAGICLFDFISNEKTVKNALNFYRNLK